MHRASNDMEAFGKVLASSKKIIAVAGAGLSAASGAYLLHPSVLSILIR